jgi:hypothetical protein
MNGYLSQKASTWVSLSVLMGGLVSACLLVFIYQVDKNIQASDFSSTEKAFVEKLESLKR